MAIEKTSPRQVREELRGYGVNGVQLNLSMAHIYNLMMLQMECRMAEKDPDLDLRAYNLVHQTLGVLDFIIGDLQSPMSEDLWKSEEKKV